MAIWLKERYCLHCKLYSTHEAVTVPAAHCICYFKSDMHVLFLIYKCFTRYGIIHPLLIVYTNICTYILYSPSAKDFPYTIRAESLITESCGSSSMATVCSCSLAMLDAGKISLYSI